MPDLTPDSAARALETLLEQERAALIAGDLDALARLLPGKEQLIAALEGGQSAPPDVLRALDGKLRRNQLLLDGALDGIRAVSTRLAQLRAARGGFETYSADGRRRDIELLPQTTVERRA